MTKKDMESLSDEALMENYQMGSEAAFEILYLRHSGKVLGFLAKKMHPEKEAQDVLQEAFFKLHRSRHLYNKTLPFAPWLFSIARSTWLDHLKKKNIEIAVGGAEIEKFSQVNAEPIFASAPTPEILDRLSATQKQAVSLRVYDEATFEEIASRLSTSPENARQLVSRGLKRLRGLWKPGKE